MSSGPDVASLAVRLLVRRRPAGASAASGTFCATVTGARAPFPSNARRRPARRARLRDSPPRARAASPAPVSAGSAPAGPRGLASSLRRAPGRAQLRPAAVAERGAVVGGALRRAGSAASARREEERAARRRLSSHGAYATPRLARASIRASLGARAAPTRNGGGPRALARRAPRPFTRRWRPCGSRCVRSSR